MKAKPENDDAIKICQACKGKFPRHRITGQWETHIGGPVFVFPCPRCHVKLATQTTWFEIRTLESWNAK